MSGAAPRDNLFYEESSHGRYYQRLGKARTQFNWDNLWKFDHLNEDVRRHLKRVYILLTFTIIACTAACFISQLYMPIPESVFGASVLGSFSLLFVLVFTNSTRENAFLRSCVLIAYGALQGVMITPLVVHVSAVDPAIPLKAFVLTSLVFVCFSLSALVSEQRKFLYLGGILTSCLFGLLFIGMMNAYIKSEFVDNLYLAGGLVVFSLFICVDTQIIIERALNGDSDSVHSALDLFLDFLNIFIRIMIILSKNNKNSKSVPMV